MSSRWSSPAPQPDQATSESDEASESRLSSSVGFLLVLGFQLLVILMVRSAGFTAISDDDYARVVIAQEFTSAPTLDPSGTSWLPFPFLVNGAAMALFGASLAVARSVSLLLALVGAWLLFRAAVLLEAPPRIRLLSVLTSIALPYSVYLGAATVPEYLSACCLVFAACQLVSHKPRWQDSLAAACALSVACASRYEAWPAAAAFSILTTLRARNAPPESRRYFLSAAGLSAAFPLLWVGHGSLSHSDPFFFIKRVTQYKDALGNDATSAASRTVSFLQEVFLTEPEVMGALVVLFVFLALRERKLLSSLLPPWIVLFALASTVLIGALRGGAPTHHPERAFLSLWLLAPLWAGAAASRLRPEKQTPAFTALLVGALLGGAVRSKGVFERQPFADRSEEEAVGRAIRSLGNQPVGVLTKDYGYFAIQAAAGSPQRLKILKTHDPRESERSGALLLTDWRQTGKAYVADISVVPQEDQLLSSTKTLALAKKRP